MNCRGCGTQLTLPLIDLGTSPPSNAYVRADQLEQAEQWVPLKVAVCQQCWLVQTEDYNSADSLFDAEYAYFSSFSSTWLAHAERYVADMVERFGLRRDSRGSLHPSSMRKRTRRATCADWPSNRITRLFPVYV